MRTKISILSIVFVTSFVTAQNVHIPDANFKAYLIGNRAINTNGDNEIQVSEAQAFKGEINCTRKKISDLTGIEAFVNLTELECCANELTSLDVSKNTALIRLRCCENKLTSLDVSKNTALTIFICFSNKLTSLDVSNNTALTIFDFSFNQLTSLDVGSNTALTYLGCSYNQLTSLDVSNNTALKSISCSFNQLITLDLSNNTALTDLNCNVNSLTFLNLKNGNNVKINPANLNLSDNPNLSCIQVDDVAYSNANWSDKKDVTACFSEKCIVITGESEQEFTEGQTIADLKIEGENLVWYSDKELMKSLENNTKLVHNTTYYVRSENGICKSVVLSIKTISKPVEREFTEDQTLADLVQNGEDWIWYADVDMTIVLPADTKISHNTTYYAKRKNGTSQNEVIAIKTISCNEIVKTPTGESEQQFTEGQTIADLKIEGENLVWYTDKDLKNKIETTTKLVHDTTYYVRSENGTCQSEVLEITAISCNEIVKTPTGESEQQFTEGQTIADLKVTGENLVWYTDKDLKNKIETTTKLVHNTTYYVRSENGTCQSEVLEIKVTEATVNRSDFDLHGFRYYPNPVNDILYFESNYPIEKIEVNNLLGQTISTNLSTDKKSLDLSYLSQGNYLVKITIGSVSKRIRIAKK